MSNSIFAMTILNRPVFVSILALTLAACSTKQVDSRNSGAGFAAENNQAKAGENEKVSQSETKIKSQTSFLALTLPDSMPAEVTTVQITLAKVEEPGAMTASNMDARALMLTGRGAAKAGKARKKCGTLVETQRPKEPTPSSTPNVVVDPKPTQPLPIAIPSSRPVPTLGDVRPAAPSPVIDAIFILKCEPGSPMTICGGGSSHLGRPEVMPGHHGGGVSSLDNYYGSSGGWDSPLATTDIWGSTSSSTTYSFPVTDKEIKIDDLDVGTYQIMIDLTDSDTGKVVEHGEGIVIVEAGKQAVAHIKMSPVPETTGSLLIILDRDPVAVATAK
jgi:hypothetical protein